jgi:hypothetical protein
MTTIFQGSPLPDITTKTTDTAPSWFTNPVTQASDIASSQMGSTIIGADGKPVFVPKTAATGLAALDPYQTKGYDATATAADAYKTGLTNATTTAGSAASAMNPAGIQAFMNPYIQNVTNEQARLANQNFQRNVLPLLGGQFVGSGGFGGQRFANALGQTGADFQSALTGQQNKSLADAYQSALTGAYNQGNLQNQVAQTQGALAGKEQQLGLTGASALTQAGAGKQAYEQSKLDYPLTNAINSMKFLSGLPVQGTRTTVGPGNQGQYGLSTLDKIGGITSLLTAGNKGAVGDLLRTGFTKAGLGLDKLNDYLNSEAWKSNPGTIFDIPGSTNALNSLTEEDWAGIV